MKIKKVIILLISLMSFCCAPKSSQEPERILTSPEPSGKMACSLTFDKNSNPQEVATRAIEIKQLCKLTNEQILNLAREISN